MSTAQAFLTDIKTLRDRARRSIHQGAVTPGYRADRNAVIEILNHALASELVCVLRYKRHYYMARGINARSIAEEFNEHAADEQSHIELIAERIVQLGGAPDYSPSGLAERSYSEYGERAELVEMIKEDLVAERVVIDSYGEIIRFLGNDDPTTRSMFEQILRNEEKHAEDLVALIQEIRG